MSEFETPHYNAKCTGDSPKLIELGPILIDYDQPLERMIGPTGRQLFTNAMEEFLDLPIRYAVDYFPDCKAGQTGKQWRNLLLYRPTPLDDQWGLPHILSAIDEAGFVPEELPSLASLGPIADRIWTVFGGRVYAIYSVGPNSLMTKEREESKWYGLSLHPYDGEMNATTYGDKDDYLGCHDGCMTWYVVSRKADD